MELRTNEYNYVDLDSFPDVFSNRLSDHLGIESFQHQERMHDRIKIDRLFLRRIDKYTKSPH